MNHELHGYLFPPIEGMEKREIRRENTHEFKGDGTPYLRVPGCLKVDEVRVGNELLPPSIEQEYPTDMTLRRLTAMQLPGYYLTKAADGTPVLLRAVISNDGIWQDGVSVWVTGEWASSDEATLLPASDEGIESVEAATPIQAKALTTTGKRN
jgi:hypothetical protein